VRALASLALAALVGTLVGIPIGLLAFAYENEKTDPGHGLAGYAALVLTFAGPLVALVTLALAARGKSRAGAAVLAVLLIAYIGWAVLLRAIVHYGVR
jgi:hypothetical protein